MIINKLLGGDGGIRTLGAGILGHHRVVVARGVATVMPLNTRIVPRIVPQTII
jgi:hypothetical protein